MAWAELGALIIVALGITPFLWRFAVDQPGAYYSFAGYFTVVGMVAFAALAVFCVGLFVAQAAVREALDHDFVKATKAIGAYIPPLVVWASIPAAIALVALFTNLPGVKAHAASLLKKPKGE